jgi:hypothetical protein
MNHVEKIYRKYGMRLHRKIFESPDQRLAYVQELSAAATRRPSPLHLEFATPGEAVASDETDTTQ